jgi:hypothetical protein
VLKQLNEEFLSGGVGSDGAQTRFRCADRRCVIWRYVII